MHYLFKSHEMYISQMMLGIDSNRKTPCLGYMLGAREIPRLTQRYDPESLSQHVVEHCHKARSLYDVLGQQMASFLLIAQIGQLLLIVVCRDCFIRL